MKWHCWLRLRSHTWSTWKYSYIWCEEHRHCTECGSRRWRALR